MTNDVVGRDNLHGSLKSKGRKHRDSLKRLSAAQLSARPARNDILPSLQIEMIPIADLKPYARKLRKSDEAHVQEVANSIAVLGFNVPLLIGKGNAVLDGVVRHAAACRLGLPTVPCIRIDHLNETEQRLLRLAVNRLGEKGTWDLGELKIEIDELIIAEAPIEITGFGADEIDQIIFGDDEAGCEQGPLEPAPGATPISKLGDVFQLGFHRLICGDATDSAVIERLMQGETARMVLTDEPFNVKIEGNVTRGDHREFKMASGEMTDAEFLGFNTKWMAALLPYLIDGGILGTFIDWRGQPIVHAAAASLALALLNLIVWAKTNAGMGSLYRSQHELLPLFKKSYAPHVNNIALGKRGRFRTNVWTYPGASSFGSDARKGLQQHPTVKPTAMLQDALIDLSQRDEIIVDPFGGSGSTLMACEKTGRICRCVELDPLYVDVIIRRFQQVSGKKAILAETGQTFEELEMANR